MFVPNNEILQSYLDINKAINKLVKLDADRLGITSVQLKTLFKISFHPDIGLGELADKVKLTKSTVSGVIDRLVRLGLVERVIPPENRRAISICLTENGQNILDRFYSSSDTIQKITFAFDLPEEETSHLLRLQKQVLMKLS